MAAIQHNNKIQQLKYNAKHDYDKVKRQ